MKLNLKCGFPSGFSGKISVWPFPWGKEHNKCAQASTPNFMAHRGLLGTKSKQKRLGCLDALQCPLWTVPPSSHPSSHQFRDLISGVFSIQFNIARSEPSRSELTMQQLKGNFPARLPQHRCCDCTEWTGEAPCWTGTVWDDNVYIGFMHCKVDSCPITVLSSMDAFLSCPVAIRSV